MMDDSLRIWLYPLGFLAAALFGARFLIQWLLSELKQESVVPKVFWIISILGNLLLCLHALIQVQYHVCSISFCNGVIAWRNLNLMQPQDKQYSLRTVIFIMLAGLSLTTCAFYLQNSFYNTSWFRIPLQNWSFLSSDTETSLWHGIGFVGIFLFSSRFWIQWWQAERQHRSYLHPLFWWTSLIGGLMSLIYFVKIGDAANYIGPLFGMVPYVRNLMLIYKKPMKAYD